MARTDFANITELSKFVFSLPAVREQELARLAEIADERRQLGAQLAAVRARPAGRELAKLLKDREVARAAVQAAEQALTDAKARLRAADTVVTGFGYQVDLDLRRVESRLIELADHRIGEFLEWAFVALNTTQNGHLIANAERGGMATVEWAQIASGDQGKLRAAQHAALLTAIGDAEALRLAVDVDVERELARIRASIP